MAGLTVEFFEIGFFRKKEAPKGAGLGLELFKDRFFQKQFEGRDYVLKNFKSNKM